MKLYIRKKMGLWEYTMRSCFFVLYKSSLISLDARNQNQFPCLSVKWTGKSVSISNEKILVFPTNVSRWQTRTSRRSRGKYWTSWESLKYEKWIENKMYCLGSGISPWAHFVYVYKAVYADHMDLENLHVPKRQSVLRLQSHNFYQLLLSSPFCNDRWQVVSVCKIIHPS
jgi:hypothetical protein